MAGARRSTLPHLVGHASDLGLVENAIQPQNVIYIIYISIYYDLLICLFLFVYLLILFIYREDGDVSPTFGEADFPTDIGPERDEVIDSTGTSGTSTGPGNFECRKLTARLKAAVCCS